MYTVKQTTLPAQHCLLLHSLHPDMQSQSLFRWIVSDLVILNSRMFSGMEQLNIKSIKLPPKNTKYPQRKKLNDPPEPLDQLLAQGQDKSSPSYNGIEN